MTRRSSGGGGLRLRQRLDPEGPAARSSTRHARRTAPRDGGEVDLARVGAGQLVDDAELGRQLVAGERRWPRRASSSSGVTRRRRAAARRRPPAPRRAGGRRRPTTAAPRTAGCALERGADVVGPHLEAAADDGLVGPAEDPQEAVGVDAGQVGGAHPAGRRPAGRPCTSSSALGVRAERLARCPGRRPAARSPGGRGRRCPAWSPRSAVVVEVPARDAAAELGGRVGHEHGHAVLRR